MRSTFAILLGVVLIYIGAMATIRLGDSIFPETFTRGVPFWYLCLATFVGAALGTLATLLLLPAPAWTRAAVPAGLCLLAFLVLSAGLGAWPRYLTQAVCGLLGAALILWWGYSRAQGDQVPVAAI